MGVIDGFSQARMAAIEASSVVDGIVDTYGHLILTKHDGTTIDAGDVIGPEGPSAPASSLPEIDTLVLRDSAGRTQMVDPSVAADVATKGYADALGVSTATVSTIVRRDANGRFAAATPSATGDVATKGYADALGVSGATASTIMRRDANSRAQVGTPSAANDIANKTYVDERTKYEHFTSGIFTATHADFTLLEVSADVYEHVVDLVIRLTYTGANVTSDSGGNVGDLTIGVLTTNYRPVTDRFVMMVREGYFRLDASVEADGDVRLRGGSHPSQLALSSGWNYSIHATYVRSL